MFKFSSRSLKTLATVAVPLQEVVKLAMAFQLIDITIVEGIRTIETQRRYFDEGKSKTMKSKHLKGLAIDIYPYVNGRLVNNNINKEDLKAWYILSSCMKIASIQLATKVVWGGDWKSFIDMPHWELINE